MRPGPSTSDVPVAWRVDALIVLLCLLAFGPGLGAGFIHYDDPLYLMHNGELLDRGGLAGLLVAWDPRRAWDGRFLEFFPLRDSVYWLLYRRWGLWPFPYHLVSLAVHALASLLVRRVALAVGGSPRVAATTALLFAVHPIHVESVTWAAGLKDPLFTCAVLGSVLAYLRYREARRPGLFALALGCFVGALLTKSMALSLPLLLLAAERFVGTPTPWRLIAQRLWGFGVVGALFVVQFVLIGRANDIVLGPHGGSWSAHLVLTAWAQVKYLQQALLPSSFRLIYCFAPPSGLGDVRLLIALGVFAAAGWALWRLRAHRRVWFAAAWYGACLLPVANLVPFPAVMADRYLYAAVFGVCLLAAGLLERLSTPARRLATASVVLVLTLTCALRSNLWHDEEALWAESDEDPACLLDTSPAAVDAHLLRARTTTSSQVALEAYTRALATPGIASSVRRCLALQEASTLALERGDLARAVPWAREAAERCPWDAASWSAVAAATLPSRSFESLAAAYRAWRLAGTAEHQVEVGLTEQALQRPGGCGLVEDAVQRWPEEACAVVKRWSADAALRPAIDACVQGVRAVCDAR